MTTRKLFTYLFLIAVGYLLVFSLTYKALENPGIYDRFFSSFMPTYENQDGVINLVKKPFVKITEGNIDGVDAEHYSYIKDNLYTIDPNDPESNYNSGFFPLFPVIWKFFSGLGIITLNYFLHFASIVLLAFAFCRNKIIIATITILALPTLTVFLLPYTEALFMFSISIALFGYKEKNNFLYVSGLIMSAATRPIFLLFLGTLIATEIYQYWRTKKTNFKNLFLISAVVTLTTFLVSLFQSAFHKGSLLTFMTVQKHWGTYFRIPTELSDWSFEGNGMNVWALAFCVFIGGTILILSLLKRNSTNSNFDYWYYFSWIYLIGTCMYVLLFQGGCLHSLYRYTLCLPFFYVIIFQHLNNTGTLSPGKRMVLFTGFLAVCAALFFIVNYPSKWDFSRLGFYLLSLNLLLFLFYDSINRRIGFVGYAVLILGGVLWNCFLYNMFFSKGWVFL
ncbi:hypothetical protein BH11BAC1_BH11BAC1_15100 [soil metagenome]